MRRSNKRQYFLHASDAGHLPHLLDPFLAPPNIHTTQVVPNSLIGNCSIRHNICRAPQRCCRIPQPSPLTDVGQTSPSRYHHPCRHTNSSSDPETSLHREDQNIPHVPSRIRLTVVHKDALHLYSVPPCATPSLHPIPSPSPLASRPGHYRGSEGRTAQALRCPGLDCFPAHRHGSAITVERTHPCGGLDARRSTEVRTRQAAAAARGERTLDRTKQLGSSGPRAETSHQRYCDSSVRPATRPFCAARRNLPTRSSARSAEIIGALCRGERREAG
ncbi:hypothetical protein OH76DRAFT_1232833 [Lentinus brumalis]|uniref:Uncharacterized protein n=1 Tax=Lentinus brumalis TaxID=2498619 RepID=A0A371CSK4_9APHY|nr:hypothetical protein OH76DRAFT_1232833 [Polyporus brumalis]